MNQNQINELLLEALVTTEIDITLGICQFKYTLLFPIPLHDPLYNNLKDEFDSLLVTSCIILDVYNPDSRFPIKGGLSAYNKHEDNLWDMSTEYGQWRHRVYDQMILTLQDKLGITE